jgi:hypothetical protein
VSAEMRGQTGNEQGNKLPEGPHLGLSPSLEMHNIRSSIPSKTLQAMFDFLDQNKDGLVSLDALCVLLLRCNYGHVRMQVLTPFALIVQALSPQPPTLSPQPPTLNNGRGVLWKHMCLSHELETRNPKPETRNRLCRRCGVLCRWT